MQKSNAQPLSKLVPARLLQLAALYLLTLLLAACGSGTSYTQPTAESTAEVTVPTIEISSDLDSSVNNIGTTNLAIAGAVETANANQQTPAIAEANSAQPVPAMTVSLSAGTTDIVQSAVALNNNEVEPNQANQIAPSEVPDLETASEAAEALEPEAASEAAASPQPEETNALTAETPPEVEPTSATAKVTPFTARANTRYISLTGDDSSDGFSRSTAWRSLMANLSNIPRDTEVIYLDGYYEFDSNVYINQGPGFKLPANVTIRAENYRQAVLSGKISATSDDSDVALAFIEGDYDVEVWGLVFEYWSGGHAGTILLENSNDYIRFIGNQFQNNGSTANDHIFYLSGGDTTSTTQQNWVIADNTIEMAPGTGAFLHIYGGPHGAKDGVVKNNSVTGTSEWAILQSNVRPDGASSNIQITDNTIIGNFSNGVMQLGNYNGPTLNGVDASFVVENNHFENTAATKDAYVIWRWPEIGGGKTEHQPTIRDNVLISNNGKSAVLGVDSVDSPP